MSSERSAGPSILGCAIGFGLAGSGVGAIAAIMVLRLVRSAVDDLPELVQFQLLYGTILANSLVDSVIGVIAGVVYARLRQRARSGP
jgi:hypothetical protein